MTTTTNDYTALATAARSLSAVCDGAKVKDDVGYSASDTIFGKAIALVPPAEWSAETARAVWETVRRYRDTQLPAHGIDFAALPEPPALPDAFHAGRRALTARADEIAEAQAIAAWAVVGGRLPAALADRHVLDAADGVATLCGPYHAGLVAAIKGLSGRRWTGSCWDLRPSAAAGLPAICQIYKVIVSDAARAWMATAQAAPAPAKRTHVRADGPDRVLVDVPYDPQVTDALRAIPTRRWDAARKINTFAVTSPVAAALAPLVARYGWTVDPDAQAALDGATGRAAALKVASAAQSASPDAVPEIAGRIGTADGLTLRPYQLAGIRYALDADGRCLIADAMGCGKSLQALGVLEARDAFPALIICPKSVKLQWAAEITRWTQGRRTVAVVRDTKALPAPTDITVINYDLLPAHADALALTAWAGIVADEAHYLKTPGKKTDKATGRPKKGGTLRTAAAEVLFATPGPVRLLLTGTPVLNRPSELITLLSLIGRIDAFGGSWKFLQRYCGAKRSRFGWDFSGASNTGELATRLRETCYVRREKADVLTELPALQRVTVPVEISDKRGYARALADVLAWMAERRGEPGVSAAAFRAEALVRINGLKQIVGTFKVAGVVAWAQDWLASTDEKIIIFANHRAVQEALLEALAAHAPARIAGDDNDATRAAHVARFQADPACRVLVASLKAAREGLNLQAASAVAFAEMGWTAAEHDQAEARAHRMGQ
jgi:hypothetical protein